MHYELCSQLKQVQVSCRGRFQQKYGRAQLIYDSTPAGIYVILATPERYVQAGAVSRQCVDLRTVGYNNLFIIDSHVFRFLTDFTAYGY